MDATTPTTTTIQYDDFAKLDLRVATVTECTAHPNADKLLVLKLDIGEGESRQICAGIKAHYTPEQLLGKQIILVANLEPRPLRGVMSQGMLLAASDASGKVIVISPSESTTPGSKVR